MRRINEQDFISYSIEAQGWGITFLSFDKAKREWAGLERSATLYGNKPDGTRAIIDTK